MIDVPQKRGRGRPRKVRVTPAPEAAPETSADSETSVDPDADLPTSEAVDGAPDTGEPKARRGRKKKSAAITIDVAQFLAMPLPNGDGLRNTVGNWAALLPIDIVSAGLEKFTDRPLHPYVNAQAITMLQWVFAQWASQFTAELPAGLTLLIMYLATVSMALAAWFAEGRNKNTIAPAKKQDNAAVSAVSASG